MRICSGYHPVSKSQFHQKVDIAPLCCHLPALHVMTSGNLRTIAEIYRHGAIFLSQTVWVFNTFRQQAKKNAIKNSLEK